MEKNKKNSHLSSVVHQINNCLANISLAAQIMQKEAAKKEFRAYAKSIIADVKKIVRLLKKLS